MNHPPDLLKKAENWLHTSIDEATRAEVQRMIDSDPDALVEAFYKDLEFGTGGIRGIMGVGTNRVNRYTLGQATQGLCNYLAGQFPEGDIRVAIAHDSRHNSRAFARDVARVLATNRVTAMLFEDLRPTPELSFAVRELNCQAGIMLTASHNPKEYNGYKVYWNDGGQLVPPHDKAIIEEVRGVQLSDVRFSDDSGYIREIGADVDQKYLEGMMRQSIGRNGRKDLKIVFTALHGTAVTLTERALKKAGFTQVNSVLEQAVPDGDFPTVASPNPEEAEALAMAVAQAEREGADLVIGFDPDADRVGIAVRDENGQFVLLNGNQCGAVLFDYVLGQQSAAGRIDPNAFSVITVVTSELLADISNSYGVECMRCLTGFKWIADLIRVNEGKRPFMIGAEESYGYLVGDFVRDKDAITAAVLIAEAAAHAKAEGSGFYQRLLDLYRKHGYYRETQRSLVKTGKTGAEEIERMMAELRNNPPEKLAGKPVVRLTDYQNSTSRDLQTGKTYRIDLPTSNVIQLINEDGDMATARPSGTEPKIKFYFSVKRPLAADPPKMASGWGVETTEEMAEKLEKIIAVMAHDLGL